MDIPTTTQQANTLKPSERAVTPSQSHFKELLMAMPDVGTDEDFARRQDPASDRHAKAHGVSIVSPARSSTP